MEQKNTLTPGVPTRTKITQLMIAANTKPDQASREWPYDYIYYNYYRTDNGFIVYQEMYNATTLGGLVTRLTIPDAMAEDFIALIAGEKLLED